VKDVLSEVEHTSAKSENITEECDDIEDNAGVMRLMKLINHSKKLMTASVGK